MCIITILIVSLHVLLFFLLSFNLIILPIFFIKVSKKLVQVIVEYILWILKLFKEFLIFELFYIPFFIIFFIHISKFILFFLLYFTF